MDLKKNVIQNSFRDGDISELNDTQQVNREDKQKIYTWLISTKTLYGFLDNTTLLAIKLFDKFVALNEFI